MKQAILTFDLEDWFQLTSRRFRLSANRVTRGRLRSQVSIILDLLAQHDARATFFVLGKTAESCPEVVSDVAARGHEIGSHGYGHELVYTLTPHRFRADIEASVRILEDITGTRPRGYRAPEFSIRRNSYWAFDVLLDLGFTYDSSVFPIKGPRYGIPDAPLEPYSLMAPSGRTITEIPLAVVEFLGKRFPVAGGGYWRLLPAPALRWAVRNVSRQREPMLYFHPAEFDPRPLNLSLRSLAVSTFTLKQNLGRTRVPRKLEQLLATQRCTSAARILENITIARARA